MKQLNITNSIQTINKIVGKCMCEHVGDIPVSFTLKFNKYISYFPPSSRCNKKALTQTVPPFNGNLKGDREKNIFNLGADFWNGNSSHNS